VNVRVLRVSRSVPFTNSLGRFEVRAFRVQEDRETGTHLAVTHGRLTDPVPLRINSACLTSETFGDGRCDCQWQLWEALTRFTRRGTGLLTYHPAHEGRGAGLFQKIESYALMEEQSLSSAAAFAALGEPPDGRDYRAACAMLGHLGVASVELMSNNPQKAEALEAAGIRVARRDPIVGRHRPEWQSYLRDKARDFGHLIDLAD
jgi:3,4-dihydroxy 2-butanone 4-phosphate synthase / GTP cyclohydrolase II